MQIADILALIGRFIVQAIDSLGYGGISLLMGIGAAGIPLPSEIIMPSSGALVAQGRFNLWGIALSGAMGTIFGSLILYSLGKYLGRELILRYGRYILLSQRELEVAERFFLKYGWLALFLGQMIPLVRSYIALPAGIGKVKLWVLVIASFLGSLIWSFFLGFLGMRLGDNWSQIEPYFREFDYLILLAILSLIIIAIWLRLGKRTSLT